MIAPAKTNGPPRTTGITTTGLSVEAIVATAQQLISASHTDELTMRRLSEQLGVSLGATYHYVADRDTLLELVAQRINSEIELQSTRPSEWAATVHALLVDYARAYGRHPGMASFVNNRLGSMPPDATQTRLLVLLGEAGFGDENARTVLATLFFYVSGATSSELLFREHPHVSAAELFRRFEQGIDVVLDGARSRLKADKQARRAGVSA